MNTLKSTVIHLHVLFLLIAIVLLSLTPHVVTSLEETDAILPWQSSPCSLNQNFKFKKPNEYSIALECQIGPEFNQFQMNYTASGYGTSIYVLTESQYVQFTEKVNSDPAYLPPESGDYIFYFYYPNIGVTSDKGIIIPKPRSDLGKVRILVKRNPDFKAISSNINVDLQMIPQKDNTQTIIIVASSVGGIVGLLFCIACCVALIFYIMRRRKGFYQHVV